MNYFVTHEAIIKMAIVSINNQSKVSDSNMALPPFYRMICGLISFCMDTLELEQGLCQTEAGLGNPLFFRCFG